MTFHFAKIGVCGNVSIQWQNDSVRDAGKLSAGKIFEVYARIHTIRL